MYDMIFKRKSFHIFRGTEPLLPSDLQEIQSFLDSLTPLEPGIRTVCRIVPVRETTCKCGAEYCILFYSEKKGDYLRNIGYMGQQADLFLASRNIGSLWMGMAKPKCPAPEGFSYVILMAIAKVGEGSFRKDMFKAKRKPLDEIWQGETLGVGEIVRFSPSACNSQPWFAEKNGDTLSVYRFRKAGRVGIMPPAAANYYNRIDMGIFLYLLELCLSHEGFRFTRALSSDTESDVPGKTLNACYTLSRT